MIAASAALIEYLRTRTVFIMADLYTITPKWGMATPGESLYYTTAGRNINGGAGAPGPWLPFPIERSKITVTRGVQVGEMDLVVYPRTNNRIATWEIEDPGASYVYGDILGIVQAGAVGGELMVTTVGEGGGVLDAVLRRPGHFYQVAGGLATISTTSAGPVMHDPPGDGCTVNILTLTDDFINNVPWLTAAVENGQLDGAAVLVQRAFFDAFGDAAPIGAWPDGVITRFQGNISDQDYTGTQGNIKVKSFTERLNRKWPRNLYQKSCMLDVYSTDCGAAQASFTTTGTLTGGTLVTFQSAEFTQADKYFDGGVITFTSGPNAGARRTVKKYLGPFFPRHGPSRNAYLEISLPLLQAPEVGDEFTIYPGCNKDYLTDCSSAKFDQQANFRGTPNVPPPETVA
ncbi:MAG: baseplate hub domain-containing protein [Candidatus Cryosericum sp.]